MGLKTLKIAFHVLLFVCNVIAGVFLVVSAFSDRIPPDESLFLSYMGLFFPFFFFSILCFVLYWIFAKKWKFQLLNIVVVIFCWGTIQRYFPLHLQTKEVPHANTIKVLTYNVMSFGFKNHTADYPNEILEFIAASNADIVCLQEYFESKSDNHLSAGKIRDVLHAYPYKSKIFLNANQSYRSGLAVFSKYPIAKSRRIDYESENNGSSIHEVSVGKKTITLINNHLESFKLTSEDRSHYSAFLKNPGTDMFDVIKGSFQQKLGPAFTIRARQAREVRKEIENARGDYVLVCGDMNDTPVSYARRTMQGDLLDAFAQSGMGLGVTYNRHIFRFRIDYILHSANLKAYNCTVGKIRYSDHYPVWCELQIR